MGLFSKGGVFDKFAKYGGFGAGGMIFRAGAQKAKVNDYLAKGNEMAMGAANKYQQFADAGPGAQDVGAYTGGQRDLAAMLQQYSQGGYMPNQDDIGKANEFAGQMFQSQRVQQTQAFQDQQTQANWHAALSGRGVNDPILRAKLAQEQTRQGALLNAQQGEFGAQYAQNMPGKRLQYAQQRVGVLGDLSGQAWQNQQNVFSMGSKIRGFANQNRGGGFMGGMNSLFKVGRGVLDVANSVAGMAMGNPMAAGGLGKGMGQISGGMNASQNGGMTPGDSPASYGGQQFGPASPFQQASYSDQQFGPATPANWGQSMGPTPQGIGPAGGGNQIPGWNAMPSWFGR